MPLPDGITVREVTKELFATAQNGEHTAYVCQIADEDPYCFACSSDECEHILFVLEFLVPNDVPWMLNDKVPNV
jgi:hypothetical protein